MVDEKEGILWFSRAFFQGPNIICYEEEIKLDDGKVTQYNFIVLMCLCVGSVGRVQIESRIR